MILHTDNSSEVAHFLDRLGVSWYVNYGHRPETIPSGKNKVLFVHISPSYGLLSPEEIAETVAQVPGGYWYLGGEPNIAAQDNMAPDAYAEVFHYYWTEIKAADPAAMLLSGSILNWEVICDGCGYQSGREWVGLFRDAYMAKYGVEPPVDIWAIDTYPLTWYTVPMTNSEIVKDQIRGLRSWLDSIPEQSGKPIWVTEVASHWAYAGWCWDTTGAYGPAGGLLPTASEGFGACDNLLVVLADASDYQWDAMVGYVDDLCGWLDEQEPDLNIGRWFFYTTYEDITGRSQNGYAGISFFDGPEVGANLTPLGELYRSYALGIR